MAISLAVLSGVFSVVVVIGLAVFAYRYRPVTYFEEPQFVALKERLRQNPDDESLQEMVRAEDRRRIVAYQDSRRKMLFGGYLLAGGLFVFVLSMRRLAVLRERPPEPVDLLGARKSSADRKQSLIAALALTVPLILVALSALGVHQRRPKPVPLEGALAGLPEYRPLPDSMKWTQFRGNAGLGTAAAMPLPLSWNAESGENILWKVPLPAKGNSSPVVWGDRLFLTGGSKDARRVYCFDTNTGDLVWNCPIRTTALVEENLDDLGETGYASPTCVTDGTNVYAFFGTTELAAVDFLGRQVWSRWFGKPDSMYGISTSPVYHGGRLFLQLDQGGDAEDGKSFAYSIDPKTGDILWKTPREVSGSWTTPIVVNTGKRDELIASGNPWVVAYDPTDGRELWRSKVLSGDVAPVPAYSDGVVFTVTEYSQLAATRTGGSGDVTENNVLWTWDEYLPDVASPVTDGRRLLVPTGYGTVTCLEIGTGKEIWTHDFDEGFWSSPILVGDTVYMTDKMGDTLIFRLSDTYEEMGRGSVGEQVFTTPAFVDSKIFIRGQKSLFCIGEKP